MAQRSLVVNFIGDDASLQAAFKRVGMGTNALESAGRRMSSVGSTMTRNLTLPILAIGGAAAKMALDFQSSTERLRTQAGATQAQVEKLRQGMLSMTSTVGMSPDQLSAGMYHVVSSMNAVLPPTQRASGELTVLKDAAKLAAVGGSDLEETSYALASAMNALHAPISQTGKVTGELNAIVGAGDMTMSDLLDAFKSGIVPGAREAGLSLQSLGAAMAVMGDMGMRGSLAGTRLRMAIALLSSPTSAAAKVLDTLGLSASQATSTSQAMSDALQKAGLRTTQLGTDLKRPDGLAFALKDLNDHLRESGLTATGAAAVMNKAFGGGRMGATITLLAENTGRLQTKFDQIGKSANQFGADWKATAETASFKWHQMVATAEADGIRLGNVVLPIVMNIGHEVLGVINDVSKDFQALPPGLQSSIITGGLIVAAVGPAMKLLGLFTGGLAKLYQLGQLATRLATGNAFSGGSQSAASKAFGAGGMWGVRGPTRAGSLQNPIVVALESGSVAGLGGNAATLGEDNAAAAASIPAGAAETRSAGGVILPAGVRAPAGAAPVAMESPAVTAAVESGMFGSLKAGLGTALSRGLHGLTIGGLGAAASQLAGQAVGGKPGKAISDIGSFTALGAGIGTAIEPGIGTALGGVAGALAGALKDFLHTQSFGQQDAGHLTKGFGGSHRSSLQSDLAKSIDAMASIVHPGTKQVGTGLRGGAITQEINLSISQLSPDQLAKYETAAKRAGTDIAKQLEAGWSQYKFQSEPIMFTQLKSELKGMPPVVQAYGVQSAVSFAQGLEKQGKLPKGAAEKMLKQAESAFPGFAKELGLSAYAGMQQFTKALDLSNTQIKLKTQLDQMRGDFPQVSQAMDKTAGDMTVKAAAVIKALQGIVNGPGSTRAMRQQATADIHALRQQGAADFTAMAALVEQKTSDMARSIDMGSASSAQTAATNFASFQNAVGQAMGSSALLTSKGTQLIADAANKLLGILGAPKIPIPGLTSTQLVAADLGSAHFTMASTHGGLIGHARGGLVQFGRAGDRGVDGIPVNMGGVPISVGSGEVGAVLTGDQQAFLNARTADVGGLPGVFRSLRTPHAQTRRGFASGGLVSGSVGYGQLEGLWDRAGGDPKAAAVMAAIAEAESGGNPSARNPSGASGLWQILGLPFAGNPFDPLTNARMAVSKFLSQGLGAWATYTSGAYKQFLNGAAPGNLAGILGAGISAPKVTGSGMIADFVRGALGLGAKGANALLSRVTPGGTGAAAVGPAGGGFNPSQLGLFDGLDVAKWIIPELLWARTHGWAGQVTSGYRSPSEVVHGMFATAPQGQSEHRLDIYPGGAVDVSDYQQFAQIIRGYPGAEKLLQLGIDPLHFSGTGHAQGGLIGASTGFLGRAADRSKSKSKPTASRVSKGKSKRPGKLPKFRPLPGFGKWSDQLNALATQIDDWGNWQGFIQSLHGSNPTEALVTMPDGSQIVNWDGMTDPSSGQFVPGINQRLSQIGSVDDQAAKSLSDTELGLDETILSLFLQEQGLAGQAWTAFGPWLAKMRADEEKRQDQVATYDRLQQLKERLPKEKSDREYAIRRRFELAIHKVQNAASTATFSGSELLSEQLAGLDTEKRGALAGVPTGRPGGWSGSASAWAVQRGKELSSIETEFAGRADELRTVAKEHNLGRTLARSNALFGLRLEEQQELHTLSDLFSTRGTNMTDRMRRLSQAKHYLTADQSALRDALQSGGFRDMLQGDLDPIGQLAINIATKQKIDIPTLLREAAALTGTVVPPSSLSSNAAPALTGSVGFSYQGQNYVAGLASGGLLGNLSSLPPFGGSFAGGGIVPGPKGAPRTIIAHGGEEYLGVNGERNGTGATGLTAALAQLTATLCQHDETVKANTRAIGTSTTSGRVTYDRGAYASLSSDDPMALTVGS